MKRKAFICLLLCILLLVGCSPKPNNNAPDLSGASVDAPQTEKALSEIKKLGESPDDNYRTWYEIFVYSFCDSNGDGVGDLKGIISRLDYLKDLGVDIIWLSPVYKSPFVDQGYDVSDYYAIDPLFGTMEDFDTLLAEAKKRDMYILMDLVVNHCSDQHAWFQKALRDPCGEYGDYFYFCVSDFYVDYLVWRYKKLLVFFVKHQFFCGGCVLAFDKIQKRCNF